MQIEIIAGSPRNPSLNLSVATYVHRYMQEHTSHKVGLIAMNQTEVPFIQKVWQHAEDAPEALRNVAKRIFSADALILSTPEYNGGYSPAMKNLLDHFPKQKRKAMGVLTSSDGAMGGMRAAQQVLQLIPALFGIASPFMLVVPKAHEKFDEKGALIMPSFEKNVADFVHEFVWLAEQLKK